MRLRPPIEFLKVSMLLEDWPQVRCPQALEWLAKSSPVVLTELATLLLLPFDLERWILLAEKSKLMLPYLPDSNVRDFFCEPSGLNWMCSLLT